MNIELNIHAMWLIEEKAIILRTLVWLRPIRPLINILMIIINKKKIGKFKLNINKIIGAIFCHVNIKVQLIQFKPSITSGNQKWKGAAPILIKRLEFNIKIK